MVIEREFSAMNRIIRSIDVVDLEGDANLGIKSTSRSLRLLPAGLFDIGSSLDQLLCGELASPVDFNSLFHLTVGTCQSGSDIRLAYDQDNLCTDAGKTKNA